MPRADSLEKTLMLGKVEGGRKRGRQRTRWLDDITDSTDKNLNKLQEMVEDREARHSAGPESDTSEQLNNNPFHFYLLPLATTSVFSVSVRVFVFDFT